MPDWSRTVHGLGDLHAGGIARACVQQMLDDVAKLPTPALHLQIGDATQNGRAAEDVMAQRWLGRLPGRWETILGNHDFMHNERTPTEWAKAYGYRSKNFTIHLPFLRIIAVAPDRELEKEKSGSRFIGRCSGIRRSSIRRRRPVSTHSQTPRSEPCSPATATPRRGYRDTRTRRCKPLAW